MRDGEARQELRPKPRSIRDHKSLWLGAASLLVASLSYVFAWYGGLWAIPVWSALAIATWRSRRQERSVSVSAGLAMAGVAVLTGVYAFVSSGGVHPALRTDAASYAPGDVVGLRLKAGIRPVGFNLCFTTLERRVGEGWEHIPRYPADDDGTITACTAEMRVMPPLLASTYDLELPPDLVTGAYRLVSEVDVGDEPRRVTTSPFTARR